MDDRQSYLTAMFNQGCQPTDQHLTLGKVATASPQLPSAGSMKSRLMSMTKSALFSGSERCGWGIHAAQARLMTYCT